MDNQSHNRWLKEAEGLRVQPDERVWYRLEQRLEQDQNKVPKAELKRWIGIAASLLIMISIGIYWLVTGLSNTEELAIHDLEEAKHEVSFAAYQHVSDINGFYESEGWRQINEGNHLSIVVATHQRNLNVKPAMLETSDTVY